MIFRVVLLLTLQFVALFTYAQSPITATLLQDRAYLAPGEEIALNIRITNPADSAKVISAVSGGSSGGLLAASQQYIDYPVANHECSSLLCPLSPESGFPILPGTSADFSFSTLRVSSEAPSGTDIEIMDIYLKLSGPNDRYYNDVHLQNNFRALITPDGEGDQAYLASLDTHNDKAGSASINASLSLSYPASPTAGRHIEIIGTLSNHGDEPITDSFVLGSHRHLGTHRSSFRQLSCLYKCLYNHKFPLDKGESMDIRFRELYYEADTLFTGGIQITGPHAIVKDSLGRTAYIYANDINILVKQPGVEYSPTDFPSIPDRQALVRLTSPDQSDAVVFDPNTGKSWLTLSKTQGMSYAEVLAHTQPGGRFAGYSIASSEQVKELLLNHLYASEVDYPGYALFSGAKELHEVTGTFLDLIGTTMADQHKNDVNKYAQAMVADAPEDGAASSVLNVWQYNIDTGLFAQSGSFSLHSYYTTQYQGLGTWLVSNEMISGNPEAPMSVDEADFRYGELFIASVDIGGQSHQVTLKVVNEPQMILELVSIQEEYQLEPVASFDSETQRLQIPKMKYYVFPATTLYFDVELQLVRSEAPIHFRLVTAEPVE